MTLLKPGNQQAEDWDWRQGRCKIDFYHVTASLPSSVVPKTLGMCVPFQYTNKMVNCGLIIQFLEWLTGWLVLPTSARKEIMRLEAKTKRSLKEKNMWSKYHKIASREMTFQGQELKNLNKDKSATCGGLQLNSQFLGATGRRTCHLGHMRSNL